MKTFKSYMKHVVEEQSASTLRHGEPSAKEHRQMQGSHDLFPLESDKKLVQNPPANESDETKAEISELKDRLELEKDIEKTFEKWDADIPKPFIDYLEENNLRYDKEMMDKIIKQSVNVILRQKYIFNRPRPAKLAPLIDMKLSPIVSKTATSPAYPSGHAAQARLIALYLAGVHPDHSERFFEMARECGESRLNAGVHYPSDYTAGVKLANKMYDSMTVKEKIQYKDLPAHVGGMEGY
jgi:hypothetical protein